MRAETVEILIEKARFEPRTAVAVAEAMDAAMDRRALQTQPVTIPTLDVRLAELRQDFKSDMAEMKSELKVEIHSMKNDLARQNYIAILGQMAVLLGIAYFFVTQVIK